MSIVKPEDFAKALNISYGTIRSKISRGGLLRNKNKLIDTENPTNYIYLLEVNGGNQSVFEEYHIGDISKAKIIKKIIAPKKTSYIRKKNVQVVENTENNENNEVNDNKGLVKDVPSVETKEKKAPTSNNKLTLEEKRELSEQRKKNDLLLSYEIRKKEAELLVVERRAELAQYELEKKAGNTLPLDVTKTILKVNIQSIFKTFGSELENIATISVEMLGGSREDLVRITNEQNIMLKKLVDIAKLNADAEIERIVTEYSEVRSRGERK